MYILYYTTCNLYNIPYNITLHKMNIIYIIYFLMKNSHIFLDYVKLHNRYAEKQDRSSRHVLLCFNFHIY